MLVHINIDINIDINWISITWYWNPWNCSLSDMTDCRNAIIMNLSVDYWLIAYGSGSIWRKVGMDLEDDLRHQEACCVLIIPKAIVMARVWCLFDDSIVQSITQINCKRVHMFAIYKWYLQRPANCNQTSPGTLMSLTWGMLLYESVITGTCTHIRGLLQICKLWKQPGAP